MTTKLYILSERAVFLQNGTWFSMPFQFTLSGNRCRIYSLSDPNITIDFSTSELVDDSDNPIDSDEIVETLTPYVGFKSATGGSVAPTLSTTNIILTSNELKEIGFPGYDSTDMPSLPVGQYYSIKEVVCHFKFISKEYNFSASDLLYITCGAFAATINLNLITGSGDRIAVIKESTPFVAADNFATTVPAFSGYTNGLRVSTYFENNPIPEPLGDGVLALIVTYEIKTFFPFSIPGPGGGGGPVDPLPL